ncbi:MAG TPA: NUDIX domain-containing protein [Candidatus Saccharimonadales bacterium]|nr:NUDIX domain-containing protein [Candidatus Saccharimonadales bacterium]
MLNRTDHQGAKGPVFIGQKLVVFERDNKTDYLPGYIDFPGGGKEAGETVFETFQREIKEEFGLDISKDQVDFVKEYPSTRFIGEKAFFVVAKLPEEAAEKIKFGPEGTGYRIISVEEFMSSNKAVPFMLPRMKDYLSGQA